MTEGHDSDRAEEKTPTATFGTMLEASFPKLKQFVHFHSGQVIRSRECATDIAQSVCREAVADREQFKYGGDRGMIKWLFTRARRKIQDRARYHTADKRDVARETPIAPLADSGSGYPGVQLADSKTPDRIAIEGETRKRLQKAIRNLPEDYQKVVTLSRFHSVPHAEIAKRIGRSESATRKILHRALVMLARSV